MIALIGLLLLLVFALVLRSRSARVRNNLPPGPPLDPLIGGLRSLPVSYPWLTLAEWGQKWGDVVYTTLFGSPVIVLNSIDAVRDLMDKRGSNYSDRPRAVVRNELVGWDTVVSMHYGDRFRKHRRLMAQVLNSQGVVAYRDIQTNSAIKLLKKLLASPEKFGQHILRSAYTSIVRVTYGIDADSDNDALITTFAAAMKGVVEEGSPGFCLVDLFPPLKFLPSWTPGGAFQKRVLKTRGYVSSLKDAPFERVQGERKAGTAKQSFLGELLDDCKAEGINDAVHEYDLKLVGAVMLGAGIETTAAAMETFLQMLAKYPEFAKKAQLEIDVVTLQQRLPTLDDRKSIPMVDCIMREVFRYNPPVPIGVPHAVVADDTYRGMLIPGGATIISNIWQMMHDPRHFPRSNDFNPERFRQKVIDLEGNSLKVLNGLDKDDPIALVYGFGRRICPGRYFADASLWLLMSAVLAVFDIGPPLDEFGRPQVIREVEFTDAHTSRPKPFKCTILPRNAKCAALIQELEVDSAM